MSSAKEAGRFQKPCFCLSLILPGAKKAGSLPGTFTDGSPGVFPSELYSLKTCIHCSFHLFETNLLGE